MKKRRCVGIDVSADEIVVAIEGKAERLTLANDAARAFEQRHSLDREWPALRGEEALDFLDTGASSDAAQAHVAAGGAVVAGWSRHGDGTVPENPAPCTARRQTRMRSRLASCESKHAPEVELLAFRGLRATWNARAPLPKANLLLMRD